MLALLQYAAVFMLPGLETRSIDVLFAPDVLGVSVSGESEGQKYTKEAYLVPTILSTAQRSEQSLHQ